MATSNRRVAAYFPTEIDEAFKAFKIKNGFSTEDEPNSNDSKALIEIVKQFLDVEYQATHSVSLPDNLVTQDQMDELRKEFNSKLSELLDESQKLTDRISILESTTQQDETLSNGELAKRLGIAGSTLSHWKNPGEKGKTPDQMLKSIKDKDPDGLGWIWDKGINRFRPEESLSCESLSSSQGKLLD
jgi:DNA-binding transcriptional regulator YiaG